MMTATLTQARLQEVVHYDPETGVFRWLTGNRKREVLSVAGSVNSAGYIVMRIDGVLQYAHRLAILYTDGYLPIGHTDHRDSDHSNNCRENLRPTTSVVNGQNRKRANTNSSTQLLGAHRKGERFRARINFDGKEHSLGSFPTPEEAHGEYIKAKRQHHEGNTL